MKSLLRQRAADLRSVAQNDRELHAADLLDQLADGEAGRKLIAWLEKQQRDKLNVPDPAERWLAEHQPGRRFDFNKLDAYFEADSERQIPRDDYGRPINIDPIEEAVSLARWATSNEPLSEWEMLPAKRRTGRLTGVAKSAKELARLLEVSDGPAWPSAIELFESQHVPRPVRSRLANELDPRFITLQSLWQQALSPMLRRLVEFAESERGLRVRDARVSTGQPNARVLARDLDVWFQRRYDHTPVVIVADLLNLLTKLDPPADADAVAKWLRNK